MDIRFDPFQLIIRHGFSAEACKFGNDSANSFLGTSRINTFTDYQITCLIVAVEVTSYIVRQTLLFTNGLEESRAHTITQQGIDEQKRIVVSRSITDS